MTCGGSILERLRGTRRESLSPHQRLLFTWYTIRRNLRPYDRRPVIVRIEVVSLCGLASGQVIRLTAATVAGSERTYVRVVAPISLPKTTLAEPALGANRDRKRCLNSQVHR